MIKRFLLIFVCCYALRPTLHADTGFLAQQAQLAWQDRDKPGETEKAIQLWEQAAKAEPGRAELWVALAKAQGRAVRHAKDSKERQAWSDRAKATAEKAVKADASNSDAYAAYGEALGQWANAHKGIHSLHAVKQAVNMLQKATALNPKNAYAHMLLAQFYRQSPRHLSVGDKNKAVEEGRLAIENDPAHAINHLALAQALLDTDKKEDAVAELQIVISLPAPADAIPETRADQENARTLLQSLKGGSSCGDAGGACSEGQP